jgi:hypothetical protein
MKTFFLTLLLISTLTFAHANYTGYSGAPGSKGTCASSCHGGSGGTITVTGFPATYQPMTTYTIVVAHNGGSPIVNFNASTRLGSSTSTAGTFTAGTNAATYSVTAENGVHASGNNVDNITFQWTSPSSATNQVTLYVAGLQGNVNGANSEISLTANPASTSAVNDPGGLPSSFNLSQNYPNPFNPTTSINFNIPVKSFITLKIFDISGKEVATLFNGEKDAGTYQVQWNADGFPSGIYFYKLEANNSQANLPSNFSNTKKLILLK